MDTYFAFGDAPFFFPEQLAAISWLPRIWDDTYAFGRSLIAQLWIDYPIRLFIKLAYVLGFSWWSIDKILWVVAAILSVFSVWKLSKYIFHSKFIAVLSVFIYTFNTYVFMLFDGGQRGVMLAYSFVPYVVYRFMSSIDNIFASGAIQHRKNIQNGLLFSILIAFDLRLAYLVVMFLIAYAIGTIFLYQIQKKNFVSLFLILVKTILPTFIISFLVHAYWILPMILVKEGVLLGEEYTGVGMLEFLSVADFSHAFSLLHPNWPENLFGKVYFLQPEFLLIPFAAFGSLLSNKVTGLRSKRIHNNIIFFSVLSLVGVFLAKGVQDPIGGLYSWAFSTIPGFVMFRDPTKFYLFIALGYSLLIGYSLNCVAAWMQLKLNSLKKNLIIPVVTGKQVVLLLFLLIWIGMLRSVFLGDLKGNIAPKMLPNEYTNFKNALIADTESSRVLWLPSAEKFSYASEIHPIITAESLLNTASVPGIIDAINSPDFHDMLHSSGIKYIVIPTDEWHKIFLKDYTFDENLRDQLIHALETKKYVRDTSYIHLAVFQNANFTFESQRPVFVDSQELWMYRGLGISGVTLFICAVLFVILKKDNHDRIKT